MTISSSSKFRIVATFHAIGESWSCRSAFLYGFCQNKSKLFSGAIKNLRAQKKEKNSLNLEDFLFSFPITPKLLIINEAQHLDPSA